MSKFKVGDIIISIYGYKYLILDQIYEEDSNTEEYLLDDYPKMGNSRYELCKDIDSCFQLFKKERKPSIYSKMGHPLTKLFKDLSKNLNTNKEKENINLLQFKVGEKVLAFSVNRKEWIEAEISFISTKNGKSLYSLFYEDNNDNEHGRRKYFYSNKVEKINKNIPILF